MQKQFTLSVKCPHCGQSFMDEDHYLNGFPAVKVTVETEQEKGILYLCPIYGCFKHVCTIKLKDHEIVTLYCPHCQTSLMREVLCKSCTAPMVGFNINVGGKVNICSRKGCQNHNLVFEDSNDLINLFYDKFDARY
jgi:endogenous inhibitor of DNA gyrase (YacG/DUF329 family)